MKLLTVQAAADMLCVHRSTVYRLIATQALRVVDVGPGRAKAAIRIREEDLLAFVDARTYDALDATTALDHATRTTSA